MEPLYLPASYRREYISRKPTKNVPTQIRHTLRQCVHIQLYLKIEAVAPQAFLRAGQMLSHLFNPQKLGSSQTSKINPNALPRWEIHRSLLICNGQTVPNALRHITIGMFQITTKDGAMGRFTHSAWYG